MTRLAHVRQSLGLSKEALAVELGVTPIGVTRLEESEDPRMSTITRFANALTRASGRTVRAEVAITLDETSPAPTTGRRPPDAWRVRAWGDDPLAQRFVGEGFVSIGGPEVPFALQPWPGRDHLCQVLRENMPERDRQAISLFVTYWEIFVQQIRAGDVMVLPTAPSTAAIGLVGDAYQWQPDEPNPLARHRRRVEWVRLDVPRREIDQDLRNVINAPGTITAIRRQDAARRLLGD